MVKLLQIGAVFFGVLFASSVYAEEVAPVQPANTQEGCCPADHPVGTPTGDCWCQYCTYKPCYYTTKRCEEYQVPCKKKCWRVVPQTYEVTRCRYVPQYYTETCCRNVRECYEVDDCKTCKRWVCDTHCKYVPQYYWKHVCKEASCPTPCPDNACAK